jgi:hypothetical protein
MLWVQQLLLHAGQDRQEKLCTVRREEQLFALVGREMSQNAIKTFVSPSDVDVFLALRLERFQRPACEFLRAYTQLGSHQSRRLPGQLRCYHVARERKQTIFNPEPVSEDGQISGGLSSFMEGELQDIRSFLSVRE